MPQEEPSKRYMDVRELSEYLGLSKWMIYKLIDDRGIPFIPFGRLIRFDRVAVDRWAEKRSVPAAPNKHRKRLGYMEQIQGQERIQDEPFEGGSSFDGTAIAPSPAT